MNIMYNFIQNKVILLSISLIVYINIVHDMVSNIAQYSVQFCAQLHVLHVYANIVQYCSILYTKLELHWSHLQMPQ